MLNSFTFNGQSTSDFGLLVTGLQTFGAPQRRVNQVQIRGRNGDLLIEDGSYENYIATYTVAIIDDFKANARDIVAWLLGSRGYHRLSDTYNPESYRIATYYNAIDFDVTALFREGSADISFICKPQRFLTSGDNTVTLTADGTITNPTVFPSRPLLRVYGNGTLTVGDYSLTIANATTYTDIDCETMQCFTGTTNMNNNVTVDEFPVLEGTTNITLSGITKVEITPRWWQL